MSENPNFDYSFISPYVAKTIFGRFKSNDSRNNKPLSKELLVDNSYLEPTQEGYINITNKRRAGLVPRLDMEGSATENNSEEAMASQPSFIASTPKSNSMSSIKSSNKSQIKNRDTSNRSMGVATGASRVEEENENITRFYAKMTRAQFLINQKECNEKLSTELKYTEVEESEFFARTLKYGTLLGEMNGFDYESKTKSLQNKFNDGTITAFNAFAANDVTLNVTADLLTRFGCDKYDKNTPCAETSRQIKMK